MPDTIQVVRDTLYLHDTDVAAYTVNYSITIDQSILVSEVVLADLTPGVTLYITDTISLIDTHEGMAGEVELTLFARILTVHNGSGGGVYQYGEDVGISAHLNNNEVFAQWVGDTGTVEDVYQADTRVVVLENTTITALVTIVKGSKMKTAYQDLTMNQGATFLLKLIWKNANGSIANLTNFTARMKLRETKGGAEIDYYVSGTEITLGGTAGSIIIEVLASVTAGYTFRRAYYDLELVSGNTVIRILEGKIFLSTEVTV